MSPAVQEGEPEGMKRTNVTVIEVDPQPNPSLPRGIILDLSPVNFLDTVGVKTLSRVRPHRSHDLIHTRLHPSLSLRLGLNCQTDEVV